MTRRADFCNLTTLILATLFLGGCASVDRSLPVGSVHEVRTTAYTHSERDHRRYGRSTAIGTRLSSTKIHSAASDWSQFPLGTKFRIIETGEVFRIEDYGRALVGTETIDLYKPSRTSMRRWGARKVHIEILEWGSPEKSLCVLEPRSRYAHVRSMIRELRKQT